VRPGPYHTGKPFSLHTGSPFFGRARLFTELPITIRKGGESTKEKVSVGRKRDDEGLQDCDEREEVRQEEHDEREEVRREEREDRKQAREDERETRRRSP